MKKYLSLVLAVLMLLSLAACGKPAGPAADTDAAAAAATAPAQTETAPGGNKDMTVGDTAADGYSLYVQADTFSDKADVSIAAAPDAASFDAPERFALLAAPVEVTCGEYDGTFFATDVTLTLPLPSDFDGEELDSCMIVCCDDAAGEVRYLEPDHIDPADGTITVTLPHFSFWAPAKLTQEEEVRVFLDSYSTKLAAAELGSTQAAEEMGPYVQAKIDALGLTEEAAGELKKAVLKELGGLAFEDAGELGAAAFQSKEEDGYQDFCDEVDSKITENLTGMLDRLGASKAASLFQSVDKTSKIAGYLAGGDTESALKEVGGLMEDAIPMGSVVTKAVGYVGAKVNECFTNWKANEVEELYRIYKNGAEDVWHNEVIAGDWESMRIYLNDSSGFTKAKAVNRFYNLDKVGELCKKYGWSYSTYEELPEKYKDEFNRRAEEGLKAYFEARLAQEAAAEKIRAGEEVCIREMLGTFGVLRSGAYCEFFGEKETGDYSLTNRLNRLVNVRNFISQFVDEAALAESTKADAFNYGTLLNEWVRIYSEHLDDRNTAIAEFTAYLADIGLLNPYYQSGPAISGIDAFMGEWHQEDGSRLILLASGGNVIEQEPDLPWYDGDVCCTEYSASLEDGATLVLQGITNWVSSPGSDERRLELDASTLIDKCIAVEAVDGVVTVMTRGGITFTR